MFVTYIFVLCYLVTVLPPIDCYSEDRLFPEFGIIFQNFGFIQSSKSVYFLQLNLQLPDMRLLNKKFPVLNMTCVADGSQFFHVCNDFLPVIRNYQDTIQTYDGIARRKFRDIRHMLPNTDDRDTRSSDLSLQREERGIGIGIAILGAITLACNVVNSIYVHKRLHSLQNGLDYLGTRQRLLLSGFVELSNDVTTLSEISDANFIKVFQNIDTLKKQANKASREINVNMKNIDKFYDALHTVEKLSRVIGRLTADLLAMGTEISYYYNNLMRELDRLIAGIQSLNEGKIPLSLVSYAQLQLLLDHTADVIADRFPEYELSFNELHYYYQQRDIIFTVKDGMLVLQIPLNIKKRNQGIFNLFVAVSVHMPAGHSDGRESFTKLNIENRYIATADNTDNFIQLNDQQIQSCNRYGSLFLCQNTLLQIHKTRHTCLSAIFFNSSHNLIRDLCDFQFYLNLIPPPGIIESRELLLVYNIGEEWTIHCSQTNAPYRKRVLNYVIINQSFLCGCSISTKHLFISAKVCNNNTMYDFDLQYTINAALYVHLHDRPYEGNLFTQVQNVTIPHLDLIQSDFDNNTLFSVQRDEPISLKHVTDLIKSKRQIFLSEIEKSSLDQQNNLESILSDPVQLIILLSMSAVALIALIMTIYLCKNSQKFKVLLAGLAGNIPLADAAAFGAPCYISWYSMVAISLYSVGIAFSMYCTYKLIVYCVDIFGSFHKDCTRRACLPPYRTRTDLYLQIVNSTSQVTLFLITMGVNMYSLKDPTNIGVIRATYQPGCPYATVQIKWTHQVIVSSHEDFTIKLPSVIVVSPLLQFKVKKLLTDETARYYIRAKYEGIMYQI